MNLNVFHLVGNTSNFHLSFLRLSTENAKTKAEIKIN